MIESIHFKNFKVLRDTTLPPGRFTLLIGPNGSGKSSALQALSLPRESYQHYMTAGADPCDGVAIEFTWGKPYPGKVYVRQWSEPSRGINEEVLRDGVHVHDDRILRAMRSELASARTFLFDADRIAQAVPLKRDAELLPNGTNLAVVLDRLRDEHPERFEELNERLCEWLPEFDRVLFETPETGHRAFRLRQRHTQHAIKARDLSEGTRFAMAILTLAYLPDPPPIIGIENPDHGVHPRLLIHIKDAMYRLAHPEAFGENRPPVQVIATTHSPYLLDLFKDRPEEVVIAEKLETEAKFTRLVDLPHFDEIIGDAPLGEAWYTGIFGGVPAKT